MRRKQIKAGRSRSSLFEIICGRLKAYLLVIIVKKLSCFSIIVYKNYFSYKNVARLLRTSCSRLDNALDPEGRTWRLLHFVSNINNNTN